MSHVIILVPEGAHTDQVVGNLIAALRTAGAKNIRETSIEVEAPEAYVDMERALPTHGVVEDVGRAGDMARQLLQDALTALDRVHDHDNSSFVRPIRTDLEKFLMDPTGAVILPRAPPYPTPMHVVAKAADSTPSAETSAGRYARVEKIHPLPSHFQIGEAVSVSFDHQDETKPPSTLKHLDVEGHVYAVRFTEGKVWYDVMTYHSDTLLRDLDSIAVFANTELENRHGAPRRTFG